MYSGISGNILMEGQGGIHQSHTWHTHGSPKTLDRLPKNPTFLQLNNFISLYGYQSGFLLPSELGIQ